MVLVALVLMFGFIEADAQVYHLRSTAGNVTDTVTNAATEVLNTRVVGDGSSVAVQFFATKISGTVAGTAYLYGSIDGTNYGQISSTTYTVTDVSNQSFLWVLSNHPVSNYQVRVVGSGTSAYSISASLLRRK